MDWVPPLLELGLWLLIEVGPFFIGPSQTTTPRVGERPAIEPDNWKCPSPAEFAQVLNSPDGALDLPVVVNEPASASPRAHPLWDRDLDF
jgi:hypothetical protein